MYISASLSYFCDFICMPWLYRIPTTMNALANEQDQDCKVAQKIKQVLNLFSTLGLIESIKNIKQNIQENIVCVQ